MDSFVGCVHGSGHCAMGWGYLEDQDELHILLTVIK